MANRTTPYGAFNYLVNFDGDELLGGFAEVSGIGTEITPSMPALFYSRQNLQVAPSSSRRLGRTSPV